MAHLFDYAFAAGWNIPLGSLSNTEETFGSRNRSASGVLYPITIRSQPVRLYPVATPMESGRVRGDGHVSHLWEMWMYNTASSYVMSLFTAASVKWTIYTRRHDLATYTRFNCWAVMPGVLQEGDLVYLNKDYLSVNIHFTDLVVSS